MDQLLESTASGRRQKHPAGSKEIAEIPAIRKHTDSIEDQMSDNLRHKETSEKWWK